MRDKPLFHCCERSSRVASLIQPSQRRVSENASENAIELSSFICINLTKQSKIKRTEKCHRAETPYMLR